MSWQQADLAVLIPAATGVASGLAVVARALWSELVTKPRQEAKLEAMQELAQLRTERDQYRDMWATSVKKSSDDAEKFLSALAKLRGKSSTPP